MSGTDELARHRFWVPSAQSADERVVFTAEQAYQMAVVLRMRVGARVRAFDGATPADAVVEIDTLSRERAAGRRVATLPQAPEPSLRLIAYPALLQRDKLESVLQKLVELGASAITPVLTERCVVRTLPAGSRIERWRSIVREAAEQSGRGVVPALGTPVRLQDALAAATGEGACVLAAPGGGDLRAALAGVGSRSVSIFVGPEGGFAPNEVQQARDAGALIVSLGPRVLRTETASPVLAALVLYELDARYHL